MQSEQARNSVFLSGSSRPPSFLPSLLHPHEGPIGGPWGGSQEGPQERCLRCLRPGRRFGGAAVACAVMCTEHVRFIRCKPKRRRLPYPSHPHTYQAGPVQKKSSDSPQKAPLLLLLPIASSSSPPPDGSHGRRRREGGSVARVAGVAGDARSSSWDLVSRVTRPSHEHRSTVHL